MRRAAIGIGAGAVFGFLLGWAHVTEYDAVHDMLLLKDPYLYLMMGSGVATAAAFSWAMRALAVKSVLDGTPVTWTTQPPTRTTVSGAVLFGTGWALACACPGPFTAQIGRGQLAGLVTAAGFFAGVALRGAYAARKAPSGSPAPALSH